MTIDHTSIAEKKAQLLETITVLKKLRLKSLEEIEGDEIIAGAVQHYLMIGIEVILDIGSHILTEDFQVSPETYEDVIIQLGKQNIFSKNLVDRCRGMGRFRNKMIHEYSDVNLKKVYVYLQKAPNEFAEINQAFSDYLKNIPPLERGRKP